MEVESKSSVNVEDEMQQSYMDYAMSVIIGRALPDVRDGMKPVQRRILYAMLGEGLLHNKKHSKCAGVVGEVLKRLHPHGDSSVYDALVRLAQPWSMRYPLVDGQGNFGSLDGDPPAAYRYTESRMTAVAETLLEDLDRDTVDFIPNFDDTNTEPAVLPSLIPNLLVNGADGIAVGMATHIPPHNLSEVISGTIALIKNPKMGFEELMQHIPGPDFPTGGIIHGKSAIISAYGKGKGIVQIRAKAEVDTIQVGQRKVEAIIVTEIPYQVNKALLIEKVANLVSDRQIDGITKIRDESDRKGMRIVFEIRKDATPEVVLNHLYKLTPMQSSFGVINLAIVEGRPVVCTLPQLLNHFVDHRRDVVTRRTQFDLKKALERMHILEGFKVALLNLDDVIQLIKSSETPKDAKAALMETYELSDIQSQAILDLRLQKLTGMERLAIEKEHEELAAHIAELKDILADASRIDAIIVSELEGMRERFGDERRTQILDDGAEIDVEDLIEDEKMVVSISHKGYIKRMPLDTYRAQKRGGKGLTGAPSKNEDFIEHLFVASTLSDILVFTSFGRLYWLKVYAIPAVGRMARGRALVNLLRLKDRERISAILPVSGFVEDRHVVMSTRQGMIKKVNLMDFSRYRNNGIVACTLNDFDELIGADIACGNDDIMLLTKKGISIRFEEDQIRVVGRTAKGVRGINLENDDEVVSMVVIASDKDEESSEADKEESDTRVGRTAALLTVCENGYGKRTLLEDYRSQHRAGKGVIDIKTEGRNGPVIGACAVYEDHGVMLITSSGKIIRTGVKDISCVGRNTLGVRLVNLEEEEKVQAIAPLRENGNGNGEEGDENASKEQESSELNGDAVEPTE